MPFRLPPLPYAEGALAPVISAETVEAAQRAISSPLLDDVSIVGATSVQVCTAVMHYGYRIVEDMIDGLSNWMDEKGYTRCTDFIGKALPNICDWGDLNLNYRIVAKINPKLCIGCDLCHVAAWDGSHQCIDLDTGATDPARVRALLDGAHPGEILAITFTRKAAREMQSRLTGWLKQMATADDVTVERILLEREVPAARVAMLLPVARGLYEKLLTAQPGITITTFHSWFLQLMRRAPLDAGVPGDAWLSEETADTDARLSQRSLFVVDPIDGTSAFTRGDARWAVSIALVEAGRPTLGVVHAPALGVVHHEDVCRGILREIALRDVLPVADAVVVVVPRDDVLLSDLLNRSHAACDVVVNETLLAVNRQPVVRIDQHRRRILCPQDPCRDYRNRRQKKLFHRTSLLCSRG